MVCSGRDTSDADHALHAMQTKAKDFWRLFKPSACSIRLKGKSKNEVFEELVSNLVAAKLLAETLSEPALRSLLERERLASTGVGMNVVIPHVKLKGLEETVLSLSIHAAGVDWNALDGAPAHIFFTVLRPETGGALHDPERHLELMRWISGLARDGDFRNFARASKNRTDLIDLLREKGELGA